MREISFDIDAADTLMFRDGQPFNQNDAGASEATSVFPPHPPTLVGALRAMLWQSLGGRKDDWDKTRLGSGTNWQIPSTLGPLRFSAPQLMYDKKPVFPAPLHLVEGDNSAGKKALTFLAPSGSYACDIGEVMLPSAMNTELQGLKTISDRWLTLEGMKAILQGKVPTKDQLVRKYDLWRMESRVGIGIDPGTRTTSDGQLYMASHVRMADRVLLRVGLEGWGEPAGFAQLRPVAGEHRMAFISNAAPPSLPKQAVTAGDRFCIIALSPVVPIHDENGTVSILGLSNDEIASACLGKPVPIGGWDSESRTSVPLRSCVPAGSVWFMKAGAEIPTAIGTATEWGFGQVLIGKW